MTVSDSVALYLKYRPQKFSELDVTEAREYFLKLLSSGKMPHAFLFVGPKGIGKTSAARILAKAVNCIKNQETGNKKQLEEPCNKCESCTAINAGSALDVMEIDAASNRGIEEIRELREKVKLAPVALTHKVFIIDECHMLTTEASNALLKTLEEPPAKTIFVLCTTEGQKVLPTIASRCSRVTFRKASLTEVTGMLKKVAKEEELGISDKSLELIANAAGGSFRDAVGLLEQVSLGGKKISDEAVVEWVGLHQASDPSELLEALVDKDMGGAFSALEKIAESGASLRVVVERAEQSLREALLVEIGVSEGKKLGQSVQTEDLIELVRRFERAGRELRDAVIPQLPLELLIVEWCGEKEKIKTKKEKIEEPASANSSGEAKKEKVTNEPNTSHQSLPLTSLRTGPSHSATVPMPIILERWSEVLKIVRPLNHSVEALLRSTRPIEIDGANVELEVFYKFHKERLETEKCRRMVEEAMEKVYGAPLRLRLKLGSGPQKEVKAQVIEENISGKEVDEEIVKAAEEIFGVEAI